MTAGEGSGYVEAFVYRISKAEEWEELQKNESTLGGDLDKSSGFVHLSSLHQVKSTLENFFRDVKVDLYLLQINAKKLGNGLKYELVDGVNYFPHFYGPLPLDAVTEAEKLSSSNGQFTCGLLLDQ